MFNWNKKGLIEEVKDLIARVENSNEVNNDRWITVHPNGEDSKGVHVLVKDGETVDEAIDKLDKKEDKVQKDDKTSLKDNEAVKRGLPIETAKKQIDKLNKGKEYRINKSGRAIFTGEFDKEGMPIFEDYKGNKQSYSLTNLFEEIKSDAKQSDKGEEQVNLEGKSKDINKLVNFIKGKTGINLSEYKGYAEDKGWSKRNQLYIDYDKLKKDWFRKDNAKYEDTLYWLGLYSDTEDNGGFGKFVTPKKDKKIDNSLTNTIAEALVEVISENCGE